MAISKITSDAIDATGFNLDSDTLTIDSTNNRVGIGTSSPNGTLTVRNGSTNTEQLILGNSTNTGGRDWRIGRDNVATGDLIIKSSDATDSNVTTERMRIDASGNVGIGTSSPARTLQVHTSGANSSYISVTNGNTGSTSSDGIVIGSASDSTAYFWNYENADMAFATNSTERMRISATSPALSIGKGTFGTAGQGYTVYGDTAPQCYFNKSQSGAVNGVLFYHSDSYVGGLNYNNTNTSLATSSDERLKDNIENSDDAGAKIDAMQVRQFDWKSTGEHQEYGFVAQELEPIFAHAIHTDLEGDYKSVDYGCLVPMLVKEIQSLRQRIADLENA